MCKLLKFPTQNKIQCNLPRRRVFYIGYRYVGPMFCQDIQQLYLKRKGRVKGVRMWSLITYGKYEESNNRKYSIELEQCSDEELYDML